MHFVVSPIPGFSGLPAAPSTCLPSSMEVEERRFCSYTAWSGVQIHKTPEIGSPPTVYGPSTNPPKALSLPCTSNLSCPVDVWSWPESQPLCACKKASPAGIAASCEPLGTTGAVYTGWAPNPDSQEADMRNASRLPWWQPASPRGCVKLNRIMPWTMGMPD